MALVCTFALFIAACGAKTSDNTEEETAVYEDTAETESSVESTDNNEEDGSEVITEEEDHEAAVASLWGDKVYTKEEVQKRMDEGLSENWYTYQLNAVRANLYSLPDNVLESIENAFGAYKWDTYEIPDFNNWGEYFSEDRVGDEEEKIHAVLDLYGISPDTVFPAYTESQLEKALADNPKIDLDQFSTYEDGDAYLAYYSYYGKEVLVENDLIRMEGVRDITVNAYEDIRRVNKITNISDTPIFLDYLCID
ncbi:MAG: hypothetical protein K5669_10080 [Lachnospiraceae bacterium]|nr:hypothetical protein [Lachnospiraceae bacterium]